MDTDRIGPLSLFLTMVIIAAVEAILILITPSSRAVRLICLGGARLLEIALVLMVVRLVAGGWKAVGLAPVDWVPGLKTGLIWSVLFGLSAGVVMVALWFFGYDPLPLLGEPIKGRGLETGLFLIVGGLIAPVAEEIVFRGILYGFFRRYGVIVALVMTTVIFVAAHMNRGIPVTQAVGGIVFAMAYEVHGRLLTPITIHVLGNFALFLLPLWPAVR
jgi:uncharacterized protein